MRRLVLLAGLAFVTAAAASVAFGSTGHKTRNSAASYAGASDRTARASVERFALDVTLTRKTKATTLHIRGATAHGKLLLRFRMEPGMRGAIVIDGPFLYLRAPAGMLQGKVQWLRRRIADINPNASELRNIHSMTPAALLDAFATTRMRPTGDIGVFEGRLPYDEPAVRRVIRSLAGDIEFRRLGAMALVGEDGRVRRLRISGLTADKSVQLEVLAYFYAVDKPVKIVAPVPDTFLDLKRELLSN